MKRHAPHSGAVFNDVAGDSGSGVSKLYSGVSKLYKGPIASTSLWICLAYVVVGAAIVIYTQHLSQYLPPLPPESHFSSPSNRGEFNARNAYKDLLALTALGERVVGSVENEQLAPAIIQERVQRVREEVASLHVPLLIAQEFFRVQDGAFTLNFLHPYISTYEQLALLIVHVRPEGNPIDAPTLLLNCHYDTVTDSPGIDIYTRHSLISSKESSIILVHMLDV